MSVRNKHTRKICAALVAVAIMCSLVSGMVASAFGGNTDYPSVYTPKISVRNDVRADMSGFYDPNVVTALPESVKGDRDISVIVEMSTRTLSEAYLESDAQSMGEYALTRAGRKVASEIKNNADALLRRLSDSKLDYEVGERYDVLLSGFEVTVKAKDFDKLKQIVAGDAELIVGEQYEKCDTKVVTNEVDVYDTGIFDSSNSVYDGSGTVIAVLDTGLDYTHTAFDVSRFDNSKEVLTLSSIQKIIGDTAAATTTEGLSAEDVYLNAKVPYAYDYADKDPDVYPIQSEHGTHVSGIIVGNDDVIMGVAPNAQLVSMKVFSDSTDGAKTSWLLAALEDCVVLGVDVINMSLGTACGFSREEDDARIRELYERIGEHGISLVCAASNDYNSTHGSEKNGALGLTTNPDTGTVGSPSTYSSALSVASVSGVKTPYLMYGNTVMYFTESSNQSGKQNNFIEGLLPEGVNEMTIEYVRVPGIGLSSAYKNIDVTGKIALVKRGISSFEEKARIAQNHGAVGCIIYNNVSGDISMTVGSTKLPTVSISQNNGEILAAKPSGTIKVSRSQVAGPFMSDFSSWGPTSDLKIKPEITAHGGEIYSAVPGQSYDRLSGTSMASPNQAGVTALIRQYVKETFTDIANDPKAVTARVNQIMMSTADIVLNKNGLPYSVRKQGAGLANLTNATTTKAYVTTFEDGEVMDKAKLELGDDANKTGAYELRFAVNNVSGASLTFDASAIVLTEGVSETLTNQGLTTVTEEGYLLSPTVSIGGIEGGTVSGNKITVPANSAATVTMNVILSAADKQYMDKSFKYGMYVEGFVKLGAASGEVSLNVPFLAFYGDWTQAPLFDLDIYETNKDELDDSIDLLDKTLPDAYATKPIGGMYLDYINYLGLYPYIQSPSAIKIAGDRKYIALSNQSTGTASSSIHSIQSVWAGMLKGAKKVDVTITDDVTGEVIFAKTVNNVRKSYTYGSSITMSDIDIDFDLADYNLKNNSKYSVKLQGYVDYGDGGLTTNVRNTFEFPFVVDFEAPTVSDCRFYTEYDTITKKTKLFAAIDIYDNHYSAGAVVGYVSGNSEDGYALESFDRYVQPLYSEFNSTYTLTYELTDYVELLKADSHNNRSFVIQVMDYAQNTATYEITIPDDITSFDFVDAAGEKIDSVTLSPYEIYQINAQVYPAENWQATLNYTSSDPDVARVVNGKIIACAPGTAVLTATSNANPEISGTLTVNVLGEGDEGYIKYDMPATESFRLTSYSIKKVYYFISSDERDLGTEEGGTGQFSGNSYALSMYPSESVTVNYEIAAYFPELTEVKFSSGNDNIVTVDENGVITAVAEGEARIYVSVFVNGKDVNAQKSINVTVKKPYQTQSLYLMKYTGLGGEVVIPADFGVTQIYQYAFSNYRYIPKDENDEISDEDPLHTKISPIGDDTITKVVIPEGVESINRYAFAKLTALREVVLPTTLTKIDVSAFEGCISLSAINLENVKFINQNAFKGCMLKSVKLDSIVAIGDGAFSDNLLDNLVLPGSAQSIGAKAFANNALLGSVTINADKVKLGASAFTGCVMLKSLSINAAVIPQGAFDGCTNLDTVTLGEDVTVVGAYAFRGTAVRVFRVKTGNKAGIAAGQNGQFLTVNNGTEILLVAPTVTSVNPAESSKITKIGDSAFSGNKVITVVNLPSVTSVGNYAFAGCTTLDSSRLTLGKLTEIGEYAFYGCEKLSGTPSFEDVKTIGAYAFSGSGVTSATIPDGTTVGSYAFGDCKTLASVTIGDDCVIGDHAFGMTVEALDKVLIRELTEDGESIYIYGTNYGSYTVLATLNIGEGAKIGAYAFAGCGALKTVTLGDGAEIGDYAFFNCWNLQTLDLSKAVTIGSWAFSGYPCTLYWTDKEEPTEKDFSTYGTSLGISFAPQIETVDLSACSTLGEGAFAYNFGLTSATLGGGITAVPAGSFFMCYSLADIDLSNVESIGASAFYYCQSLIAVDLRSAKVIGSEAFAESHTLEQVALGDGVEIGSYAFYGDDALARTNLKAATYVGAYAFAGAEALTTANLQNAAYIGELAFYGSGITSVELGASLVALGDNPFASCEIDEFTDNEGNTTFTLSDTVYVEDGVLYGTAPNGGKILVTYPLGKKDRVFFVPDGVVRVSARAFAGAAVETVQLPWSLGSIGDKAFYECEKLYLVVFKSAYAPVLEEDYDTSYALLTNLPLTGSYETLRGEYEGLGIVPYYMWNIDMTYFYYGANFVNYVGREKQPLVMVRPSNGDGYETFIMGKYFETVIDGAVAAYKETQEAIDLIAALPDFITLDHEAQVVAAREAYDKIALVEQQALVTNIGKLTDAEATIDFLKNLPDDNPKTDPEPEPVKDNTATVITLAVLTAVFGLAAVALGVLLALILLKKKKSANSSTDGETTKEEETPTVEEATEEEKTPVAEEVTAAEQVPEEKAPKAEQTEKEKKPAGAKKSPAGKK